MGRIEGSLSLNKYTYCYNNPLIYYDPTGNYISLSGNERDQQTSLKYLQQLTDYPLEIDEDGNLSINKDVVLAVRYENGNELLERLIDSKHIVNIELIDGDDGNAFCKDNDEAANPAVGCGGTVLFNPNKEYQIVTVNKYSGYASMKNRPAYIGLGHELIHAERATRGVDLGGDIVATSYKSRIERDITFFSRIASSILKESIRIAHSPKEEVATVGLKYNTDKDITENNLRWEHGLELRGAY